MLNFRQRTGAGGRARGRTTGPPPISTEISTHDGSSERRPEPFPPHLRHLQCRCLVTWWQQTLTFSPPQRQAAVKLLLLAPFTSPERCYLEKFFSVAAEAARSGAALAAGRVRVPAAAAAALCPGRCVTYTDVQASYRYKPYQWHYFKQFCKTGVSSPRKSAAQVLCNEDCPLMIISSRPRDCLFCEKLAWDFHIKKIHNCCVFPFACL
ncbi:uncharacterized protein ACIB01_005414 [Guaruba guarouba]